jgi:single-stranded DNA-binding protein
VEARECSNESETSGTYRREISERRRKRSCKQKRDTDPLRKAQDWEFKEVEGDVATKDWVDDRGAARIEGDRVLPEADRLPVRSNLCANEERDEECADAQDTAPNCGNSAAATRSGAEEVAERLTETVHANLTSLIDQRLALWARRLLLWLSGRRAAASRNQRCNSDHAKEEDQGDNGAPRKEGPLDLKSLPEEFSSPERLKPARVSEKANDRSADKKEAEECWEEE